MGRACCMAESCKRVPRRSCPLPRLLWCHLVGLSKRGWLQRKARGQSREECLVRGMHVEEVAIYSVSWTASPRLGADPIYTCLGGLLTAGREVDTNSAYRGSLIFSVERRAHEAVARRKHKAILAAVVGRPAVYKRRLEAIDVHIHVHSI